MPQECRQAADATGAARHQSLAIVHRGRIASDEQDVSRVTDDSAEERCPVWMAGRVRGVGWRHRWREVLRPATGAINVPGTKIIVFNYKLFRPSLL